MEISEFIYTEKIFNVIAHTAKFVTEETYQKEFHQLPNKRNCFHSAFLFKQEILSYVRQNIINGKPSVSEYPGPCYSNLLRMDFDGNGDLEPVRKHTQKIAEALSQTFQIPQDSMRYFFTGKKGFNIEIPSIFFDAKPDQRFNEITKKVINNLLMNDSEFRDPSVYDKVRFWRNINSIHGETGLHKIPLTYQELGQFTADRIKELAKEQRQTPSLPKATPIPILIETWNEAKEELYSIPMTQPTAVDITRPPHDAKVCYWKALNEGVEERNPGRHMWGLRIAKYLRQDLGFPPDVARSCFLQWNQKNRPPLNLPEKEVDRFINDGLRYDFGCNDEVLKSKCHQECRYYKKSIAEIKDRGWGRNLIEILDEPEEESTPLIEGMLYEGDKGYITSTYKLGKTLFLMHMSLCLATAIPFLGFKIPKARKVLYIRFELKEARFKKRLALMLPALGGRKKVEKKPVFHLTRNFDITRERDFEWLVQMIYKHEPEVLFLDPFYKLTFLDLKESASAIPIIQKFDILADKFPSLNVCTAHHLRKQSGGRKTTPGMQLTVLCNSMRIWITRFGYQGSGGKKILSNLVISLMISP